MFRWDCERGFVVGEGLTQLSAQCQAGSWAVGCAQWSGRVMGCVLKFGGARAGLCDLAGHWLCSMVVQSRG